MAKDPRVDAYIAKADPALQPILRAARGAIGKAAPELEETMCMGMPHWKGRGWVAYLADYAAHVNLGLHRGAQLRQRAPLEGTGKALRHVKLRSVADARAPEVARLVREAAALDARLGPQRRRA